MIAKTRFEKNLYRTATVCVAAFERAKQTYSPNSDDFERVSSFYTDEKLNLQINWLDLSLLPKLNTILVNIEEVNLSNKTTVEQEAQSLYKIFVCAKGENTHETAQTVMTGARVLREKLTAAPLSFFEGEKKEVSRIVFNSEKISQVAQNVVCGEMSFNITTKEPLSDFDDIIDFDINESTIKASGGVYQMIWDKRKVENN